MSGSAMSWPICVLSQLATTPSMLAVETNSLVVAGKTVSLAGAAARAGAAKLEMITTANPNKISLRGTFGSPRLWPGSLEAQALDPARSVLA